MKLAYQELARQKKVVSASLIPQHNKNLNSLEWAVEDEYDACRSYIVLMDLSINEFMVEVFQWDDLAEDWLSTEVIDGQKAEEMARQFKLIY